MALKDDDVYTDDIPVTPAEPAEPTVAEVSRTDEAEAFDLDAWMAGAGPATDAMILYSKAHLLADIHIAEELEMKTKGAQSEAYRQEATRLTQELLDSGMVVRVESRSVSASRAFDKSLDKRGIKDPLVRRFHQMVDQIVEPRGVTLAHIEQWSEWWPGQMADLARRIDEINNLGPRLNPRFLQPSSDSPAGEG